MVQGMDETEHPDLPQAIKLLSEMNTNIQQVSQLVDNMIGRVKGGELSTEKGLSFLEMKYQMLLSYLINITYIVLRKSSGEKIESDPSIDRLIEIRTVLEKIRPIDSKLQYQIDKLVKTAAKGDAAENDAQTYKPSISNLPSKLQDNDPSKEDSEEEDKTEKVKSNIYVPPKLAPVYYDGDTSRTDLENKAKEKSRKKFLNSSIMRELRVEYSDAPVEVRAENHVKHSISKYEQEKIEYEENYLTRLPVTKAEKNMRKKLTTIGMLGDEITSNIGQSSSLKRKMKSKKGKGFKRRRL